MDDADLTDDELIADVRQLGKIADIAGDETLPQEWRDAAAADAAAITKKHGR